MLKLIFQRLSGNAPEDASISRTETPASPDKDTVYELPKENKTIGQVANPNSNVNKNMGITKEPSEAGSSDTAVEERSEKGADTMKISFILN